MKKITTTMKNTLWKSGKNGNIEFLSSWKRLEREQPEVLRQIRKEEVYICQDIEYFYKVGNNAYGLWLSRCRPGYKAYSR